MSEHRELAEQALLDAQRTPILSAEQLFTATAQVHSLLAIEARLVDLLSALRPVPAPSSP